MNQSTPSVVLQVGELLVAVDCLWIAEMIRVPAVARLATAPDEVRGVCDRRGRVLILADLRRALGLPSLCDENLALAAMLSEREDDHRRWLNELEACVCEGRSFAMTLDPHACAFGRWYDGYAAPKLVMQSHLRKFEAPHAAIHALGARVVALVEDGRQDEALSLIESSRATTLARLTDLFEEARGLVLEDCREIAVIHDDGERLFGLVVDSVERVERLSPETVQPIEGIGLASDALITTTARMARDERFVLLLDAERLGQRIFAGPPSSDLPA